MGKRLLVGGSVAIVVGICLVVLGGCLNWVIFPAVVEYEVYKNLDLREGTEGWKAWVRKNYRYPYQILKHTPALTPLLCCRWNPQFLSTCASIS